MFPAQFCVKVAPELNVIPLVSAAVKAKPVVLTELSANVIAPLMLPFAPVATLIVKLVNPVAPKMLSCEPVATVSASVAGSLMVKVFTPLAGCKVTAVFTETCNLPIVCVGTFVAAGLPPRSNKRTSLVAGAVRLKQ